MTKKLLFPSFHSLCLGLALGLLLTLSACAGLPIGGIGGNPTPTPTNTAVPTTQPTIPATPTPANNTSTAALNVNLIANGNAEAGPGSDDNEQIIEPIPGWTRHGPIDVMQYTARDNGFVQFTDPGPADRGKNYFWGGGDGIQNLGSSATTSITQTTDLSALTNVLATGNVQFTLSGWFGGYLGQNDNGKLTLQFVSASGQVLATDSVGPVLAIDRNNADGLLQRTTNGKVPATTTKILVTLTMTRTGGADNDGSADDLSLIFHQ